MSRDLIKSIILWERSKLVECSKKKRRGRSERWNPQKDGCILFGGSSCFIVLRNEYKKNGLICDLIRCDIYYTASWMESEMKITFIVVGPDPENTAHLFAVFSFYNCEITALTLTGPTRLQPYLYSAYGNTVFGKLGSWVLMSLNYADFTASTSSICIYRVESTAKPLLIITARIQGLTFSHY